MEQTDKKISQMPPLQTVSGDEIVPVVKSGGNYSTLVSQIVALARQTMVEAQAGKDLSANDFTDALKAKLEGLSNYDDAEVRSLITAVNGRLDTILGDGASSAIDTFNEIEAFLTGITDTQTLTGLLQQQKQTITSETDTKLAGKVDKVSGKGLSANDYTNADKTKLDALPIKAELDTSLASKQPAITASDDIAPLGSDKLALTDKAKMAELIATAKAAGVDYNAKTGYFEYNTLVDITTEELRDMLSHINEIFLPGGKRLANSKARTNIVTASSLSKGWGGDFVSLNGLLVQNDNIEILKLGDVQAQGPTVTMFCYRAYRLKKVLGELDVRAVTQFASAFKDTPLLSDITLWSLKCSIAFSGCPLLSLESLQYLVTNAANTTEITVTVHPDVYAKLTDESNAEWHTVLTDAEAKQITFATTN